MTWEVDLVSQDRKCEISLYKGESAEQGGGHAGYKDHSDHLKSCIRAQRAKAGAPVLCASALCAAHGSHPPSLGKAEEGMGNCHHLTLEHEDLLPQDDPARNRCRDLRDSYTRRMCFFSPVKSTFS